MYKFATRTFHSNLSSSEIIIFTESIRVLGIDLHSKVAAPNLVRIKDSDDNVLIELVTLGVSQHYHLTIPFIADNGLKVIVETLVNTPENVDIRVLHFSGGG